MQTVAFLDQQKYIVQILLSPQSSHMEKHVTFITEKSTHLNERMPVGDRFSGICEHFIPVFSTKAVCIIANSAHTDDLIMAYSIGARGKERKDVITAFTVF